MLTVTALCSNAPIQRLSIYHLTQNSAAHAHKRSGVIYLNITPPVGPDGSGTLSEIYVLSD